MDRSLQIIREGGAKSGLVLNPATSLNWLQYLLDKIDLILLMSVNPGFSGQEFISSTLDKISEVREMIDASGRSIRLEVDGGIKVENVGNIAKAGADTFVSGSAIFGANDYAATIVAMRKAIEENCS